MAFATLEKPGDGCRQCRSHTGQNPNGARRVLGSIIVAARVAGPGSGEFRRHRVECMVVAETCCYARWNESEAALECSTVHTSRLHSTLWNADSLRVAIQHLSDIFYRSALFRGRHEITS